MQIEKKYYKEALKNSINELEAICNKGEMRGLEAIIHKNLCSSFENEYECEKEKSLKYLGGNNIWKNDRIAKVDIAIKIDQSNFHAIELKVVRMPNKKHASTNQCLYEIGQISSDYWRLKNAIKVKSGELGILLCGPLVKDLKTPIPILREFHNRMFLDYITSSTWGELKNELLSSSPMCKQRKYQIECIEEMGFTKPFIEKPTDWMIIAKDAYAYVSIPVKK